MSVLTSVSIREENRKDYNALRIWLCEKNMSMGDYLVTSFRNEFADKNDQSTVGDSGLTGT